MDEAQEPERPAEAQEEAVPGRQSTSEEKAAGDDVSDPLPHVKAESKPSDNSTGPAPAEVRTHRGSGSIGVISHHRFVSHPNRYRLTTFHREQVAKDAPARGKEPSSARSSIFGGKSSPGDREGSKLRGLGPLATLLATVQAYVESLAIYGTRFKLETPAKLIAAMVIRLVAALLVAYYPLFDGLDCSLLDTPSLSTSWRCGAIGWGITVASLTIAIPAVVALLLSLFHFHLARWFIPRGAALGTMIAALAGTLLIYALVVIVPVSPETSLLYQGARGLLFAFLTASECAQGAPAPPSGSWPCLAEAIITPMERSRRPCACRVYLSWVLCLGSREPPPGTLLL